MVMELLNHDLLSAFLLLVGLHFWFDYPGQGDFLACQKNPGFTPRYIPWYHANFAHAAIHGLPVGIVTGSVLLGICEVIIHFFIDLAKSKGFINIHVDQVLHILCKALWVTLILYGKVW
jgi:hypothetical protein